MSRSPMSAAFERTLAFHCAPSLSGAKPADLVSGPEGRERTARRLARLAGELEGTPVRLRLLGTRGGRSLILVYRRALLARQLSEPRTRALLLRRGYPADRGPEAMLDCLSGRLGQPGEFPHEIGLFLGYPPGDVEGFCRYRGRECLFAGWWKVYSDPEGARRRFEQYRRCRQALYPPVCGGLPLAQCVRQAAGLPAGRPG